MTPTEPGFERRRAARRKLVRPRGREDRVYSEDVKTTIELVLSAAREAARRQRRKPPSRDDAVRWLMGDEALDPAVRAWVDTAKRVSRQRARYRELRAAIRNDQPLDLPPVVWP